MTEFVSLDASIKLDDWTRAVNAMIDDSARLETALKSVSDVSQKLEQALKGGDVKVNVQVDGSMIDKAVSDLAILDGATPLVDVTVDSGQIDTAEAEVLAIDGMTPDVEIEATFAELLTAESKIKNLDGEQVSVPIKTETSDADKDIADIKRDLQTLKTLAIIDFVINIPATFTAFYEQMLNLPVLGSALGFIVDTDAAVASFNARTSETIDGLDQIIDRLYTDTGVDKGTIADTLVMIAQQSDATAAEIEELALKSLEFSQIWGTDVNANILTAQRLVASGLAKDFDEAFDIMTYGMETGANRADDFFDAIGEFGIDFAQLGLTGKEAVDLINSGLDKGVQNAGRVGEAYNGLNQQIQAGSEETQAFLDSIGVDPTKMDLEAVLNIQDAIAGMEDLTEQTAALTASFGSGGVEISAGAITGATITDTDITGAFDKSVSEIEGSMSELFAEFGRTLEVEIITALDNAFDFKAMLERGKEAARAFIEAIEGGEGLAGAIEIALALPGFEDSFHRFEASIGELIIAMLEVAASVGEFLGKDVTGLRATIKDAATTQLEFTLGFADSPEEIEGAIATAMSHGLEAPEVQAAVDNTITDMIEGGKTAAAQAFVQMLQSGMGGEAKGKFGEDTTSVGMDAFGGVKLTGTAPVPLDLTASIAAIDTQVSDLNAAYRTALENEDWDAAHIIGADMGLTEQNIADNIKTFRVDKFFEDNPIVIPTRVGALDFSTVTDEDLGMQEAVATVEDKTAAFFAENPIAFSIPAGFELDDSDFSGEERLATITTDLEDLETTTNQVTTGVGAKFGSISSSANDMKSDIASAVADIDTSMVEFSASAETNIGIATNSWLAFGGALTDVLNSAGPALASIIAVLGTAISLGGEFQDVVDSAAAPAAGGGSGGGKPNAGHAAGTGNTGIGSFVAGEDGPEIVTTDRSLAVLNNDTTRALWAGIRAGSAMNSNVQNNRTANVYNTFNVQSQAQAVSAGQVVANKVRGY